MSVGLFLIALAAGLPKESPTLKDAITCARDYGRSAALPPESLIRLAPEAQSQCENRFASTIQQSVGTASSASNVSEKSVRDNIDARLRIEAVSQLIARLEGGEPLPLKRGTIRDDVAVIKAYVECARLAAYRKANSVFMGDTFPQSLKGRDQQQVDRFFVSEVRSTCPVTRRNALTATDNYLRANGGTDAAQRQRDVETSLADTEVRAVRPVTHDLLQGAN